MIHYLPADTPADAIPDLCTRAGRGVWYLEPGRTPVDLAGDVLPQLACIHRYAGARRWNVLQHTALCVRVFDDMAGPIAFPSRESAWASLLARRYVAAHDLHEAYVLDLPSGLKRRLPEYKERIEAPWEGHVHRSLGLEWPVPPGIAPIVKHVDGLALVAEMSLLGHPFRDVAAARRGIGAYTMRWLHEIAGEASRLREHELCSLVTGALAAEAPGTGEP